jgi:hypothetical protein
VSALDLTDFNNEEQAVKVVYADNCCNCRNILHGIFPACLVKLDPFHWLKQWNDLLVDPKLARAGIFRGLMSLVLFNITPHEQYERAKEKMRFKKKHEPSEANSVIPDPETLRSNITAAFQYIQTKDNDTMRCLATQQADDTSLQPKLFMKSWKVQDIIRNQLVHVDKGCLTDPTVDLVNIFRRNPVSNMTYVARGTNTNKRDNLDLAHKILTASHIGKSRELLLCLQVGAMVAN